MSTAILCDREATEFMEMWSQFGGTHTLTHHWHEMEVTNSLWFTVNIHNESDGDCSVSKYHTDTLTEKQNVLWKRPYFIYNHCHVHKQVSTLVCCFPSEKLIIILKSDIISCLLLCHLFELFIYFNMS